MAVPEIIIWEEVDGFAYRLARAGARRAGPVLHPDIDLEGWIGELGLEGSVTLNHLSNRKVLQLYKDGREPSSWSVYRCLNAEIDLPSGKYILNDDDWYSVEKDYVTDVDRFYQRIKGSSLKLPSYGTKTEPAYLLSVPSVDARFACMDRKTVILGGGRSRIEFCDLYSKSRDIVHVKQYGGSSLLSHLFSQALVSAEAFLHEPEFRQELNKKLPGGLQTDNSGCQPKGQRLHSVYRHNEQGTRVVGDSIFQQSQHETRRSVAPENGIRGHQAQNRTLVQQPNITEYCRGLCCGC